MAEVGKRLVEVRSAGEWDGLMVVVGGWRREEKVEARGRNGEARVWWWANGEDGGASGWSE